MTVNFIGEGMSAVTPYLYVEGAAKAVDFYKRIFGAEERMRMAGKDGTVLHAELVINGGVLMMGEAQPDMEMKSPKQIGGSPGGIMVYVPDADATMKAAVAAGATQLSKVEPMFWGDRMGRIVDPWGHQWSIGTHVEDVPPAEIENRAQKWLAENT